jgi:hypothetical protein
MGLEMTVEGSTEAITPVHLAHILMHRAHIRHFDRREKSRGAHALTREVAANPGFAATRAREGYLVSNSNTNSPAGASATAASFSR